MDSKSEIRNKCKEIRKTLDLKSKSEIAINKIRALKEYKCAKNVMIYYPLRYEINLLELLKDDKNFYLPKVNNIDLLVCPYSNDLKLSEYNIQEPCTNPINPSLLDLIIVPALAADKNNYRLGFGKGFYDRFLSKYQNIKTITAVPNELYFEELPKDKFDIKINNIIIL